MPTQLEISLYPSKTKLLPTCFIIILVDYVKWRKNGMTRMTSSAVKVAFYHRPISQRFCEIDLKTQISVLFQSWKTRDQTYLWYKTVCLFRWWIFLLLFPQHFTSSAVCWLDCRIGFSLESTTYCVIIEQGTQLPLGNGRSEIGLMESRVAIDWAYRIRGRSWDVARGRLQLLGIENWFLFAIFGHEIAKRINYLL